jgi:XTP/dITP diphosphohydrolase
MARLILVDTSAALPGLLPLHGWSALMSSELVLLAGNDHPFAPHLAMADLRHETLPVEDPAAAPSLTRTDLLTGVGPRERTRVNRVVDAAREHGDVTYLLGPADDEAFTRALGLEAARAGLEVEMVYLTPTPKGEGLLELVAVEERLRGPDGCPWDREQSHRSLARYAVEEVYELLEAIEGDDTAAIREELGDVLLQVVFHAQIAQDEGRFTIDDVARGIVDKLVRRHPHVFADARVSGAAEVVANWDRLKRDEKPRAGVFEGVPAALPALQYAGKLLARAAEAGVRPERGDVGARLDAVGDAEDDDARAREVGLLLLDIVALAEDHGVDAESALRAASWRFRDRVESGPAQGG